MRELQKVIHAIAKDHGFWDQAEHVVRDPVLGDVEGRVSNPSIIPEKLALIHSEVSEALEDFRKDNMDHFGEELADVVIRVLDLAEWLGIDLEQEIERKIEINKGREFMHGKRA